MPDDSDLSHLRISDAERHRVAELLRTAAGDGRLDATELDERLEATYAARTFADLVPITADLPTDETLPAPPQSPGVVRRPAYHSTGLAPNKSTAVMGDCKRKGEWTIGSFHSAVAVMGDVVLDLREVTFSAPETVIKATSVMGDVRILIDEFTDVVVEGASVMGDFKQKPDKVEADLPPDAPRVRVEGMAVMGDVSVQRLPPPGTPRKIIGRY